MKALIDDEYIVDFSQPIDVSISLKSDDRQVNSFGLTKCVMKPFRAGNFIGSVKEEGSVNCFDVIFNPHGNGTHTECVGHISAEHNSINKELKHYMFLCQVMSISPSVLDNGDFIIKENDLKTIKLYNGIQAIAVRTLPNEETKLTENYSGKNAAYFESDALKYIADCGIEHLLTDLPSVDKEDDGGKLSAHHAFWKYPENTRTHCTITEFIYIKNEIPDGLYIVNLQVAPFELDASPSRVVLYSVTKKNI